jgi:hypothetical protein
MSDLIKSPECNGALDSTIESSLQHLTAYLKLSRNNVIELYSKCKVEVDGITYKSLERGVIDAATRNYIYHGDVGDLCEECSGISERELMLICRCGINYETYCSRVMDRIIKPVTYYKEVETLVKIYGVSEKQLREYNPHGILF